MARQTHPHRPTHRFNKDDSQAAKDRVERQAERESEVPSPTLGNGLEARIRPPRPARR